jgi:hypothetical protein
MALSFEPKYLRVQNLTTTASEGSGSVRVNGASAKGRARTRARWRYDIAPVLWTINAFFLS